MSTYEFSRRMNSELPDDLISMSSWPEWKRKSLSTAKLLLSGYLPDDLHNVKILASLVPDEIIYNVGDYKIRSYNVVLLFGDVSGFTDLCEKYSKSSKGGPSRLTQVLNKYIASLVQEVLIRNGDVLKFSGDAFLAMWKINESDSVQEVIHDVVDCAITIQNTYGSYDTDVGVTLKVKLAIAAGPSFFSSIGDDNFSHYVIVGPVVQDVKDAEYICSAGDTVVSPAAWRYLAPDEYIFKVARDGRHHKVVGMSPMWKSTHRDMLGNQRNLLLQHKTDDSDDSDDSDSDVTTRKQHSRSSVTTLPTSKYENLLRPSVNTAVKTCIPDDLERFMIPPVTRTIGMNEPLEFLTEMRHVVIVFINVITKNIPLVDIISTVNELYKIICNSISSRLGCVNKVSLFDKDTMFLCVFGLRGYKQPMEAQAAIKCAWDIRETLIRMENLEHVSIGVTSGMTYCGVVGHTLRREYTVISMAVNKAARLMVAYPDKITCDRETFLMSKLNAERFTLQVPKILKGFQHVGPIYEYRKDRDTSSDRSKSFTIKSYTYPMLGRDFEIKNYLNLLREHQIWLGQSVDLIGSEVEKNQNSKPTIHCLVLNGEAKVGKTRLLHEMKILTPATIKQAFCPLDQDDGKTPYKAIRRIIDAIVGVSDQLPVEERTKIFQKYFRTKSNPYMCALNDVLNVKFDSCEQFNKLSPVKQLQIRNDLFVQFVAKILTDFWIIFVDNCQYLDDSSTVLLQILISNQLAMFVLALGYKSLNKHEDILYVLQNLNDLVHVVNIEPMAVEFLAALACQFMHVQGISTEIDRVIQMHSQGNPGWIENFLKSMLETGQMKYACIAFADVNDDLLILSKNVFIRQSENTNVLNQSIQSGKKSIQINYLNRTILTQLGINEEFRSKDSLEKCPGSILACVVTKTFNADDLGSEARADVTLMNIFDSMKYAERALLKCCSVLGKVFRRDMLSYIMSDKNPRLMAGVTMSLFDSQILACAQGDFTTKNSLVYVETLTNRTNDEKCACRGVAIDESCGNLPPYASCAYMRFTSAKFCDMTYELITDEKKKEYHERALRFVEYRTKRCQSCGGDLFAKAMGKISEDIFSSTVKLSQIALDTSSMYNIISRASFARPTMTDLQQLNLFRCFGLISNGTINLLTPNVRTFSEINYTKCVCSEIFHTSYKQLLMHSRGAELYDEFVEFSLEYSLFLLHEKNINKASELIDEAFNYFELAFKDKDEDDLWRKPIVRGKMFLIRARIQIINGDYTRALEHLHTCLAHYGLRLPMTRWRVRLTAKYYWFKLNVLLRRPETITHELDVDDGEYYKEVCRCLANYFYVFDALEMFEHAEMVSVWCFYYRIKYPTEYHFYATSRIFGTFIEMVERHGYDKYFHIAEHLAYRGTFRHFKIPQREELYSIIQLYTEICLARFKRGDLPNSATLSLITTSMCLKINEITHRVRLTVIAIISFVYQAKLFDAVAMLNELRELANDNDEITKLWFNVIVLEFHLSSGYSYVEFDDINRIEIEIESIESDLASDNDLRRDLLRRYFTNKWLWMIRNNRIREASQFSNVIVRAQTSKHETILNLITELRRTEGLIILLDRSERNERIVLIPQILEKFQMISVAIKTHQVIIPRYLLLKAYFSRVMNSNKLPDPLRILDDAEHWAMRLDNELEEVLIKYNKLVKNHTNVQCALNPLPFGNS